MLNKKNKLTLILSFLLSNSILFGQLNNTMFNQNTDIHNDSNKFFLNIKLLGFNKNNEYFGKIADGYTLFGYHFNPSISYQPNNKIRIDMGVFAHKDFGNKNYTSIQPTFTFSYKNRHQKLLFGTLEAATSHQLIEPLFDFEKMMVDRIENGLQYKIGTDRLSIDAWLDWQNMLYQGENDQEKVTGGINALYKVYEKKITFSIPFQMVMTHLGGQIDVSNLPLQTLSNFATGIDVEKKILGDGPIRNIKFNSYYVLYKDLSFEQLEPFLNGDAMYLNTSLSSNNGFEFMISYWKGAEFISIQGGQLYSSQSSSVKHPFHVEKNRELLIFRIFHNTILFKNLTLSSRFEPHFDIINKNFDFSHGFYLNYNVDFIPKTNPIK